MIAFWRGPAPRLNRSVALAAAAAFATAGATSVSAQVALDSSQLGAMRFRYIGPVGNRIASVAAVSGDANVYYAGAASGGLWKSTDAGIHWAPIFDDKDVSSIGALAVASSDPNIVWAGTGEP